MSIHKLTAEEFEKLRSEGHLVPRDYVKDLIDTFKSICGEMPNPNLSLKQLEDWIEEAEGDH